MMKAADRADTMYHLMHFCGMSPDEAFQRINEIERKSDPLFLAEKIERLEAIILAQGKKP